jgi:hypothetical protein
MGRLDDVARWAVARLRGQAKDGSASHPEALTFLASGFWVRLREGHDGFCPTNHNVDPSLKRRDLRLTELELEVRHHDGRTTTFHRVKNWTRRYGLMEVPTARSSSTRNWRIHR